MSNDHLSEFLTAMQAAGCGPARQSDIKADNSRIYFQLEGDKPGNMKGAASLKIDGDFAFGWFINYREGITHSWHSKANGQVRTEEEKAAFKARIEEERKRQDDERLANEENARNAAKVIWDGAEYARPDHPYLVRKKVKPHNTKQHEGRLLIPMYADKKLQAYQTIDEDGDKLYLTGARKKGCYCPLMDKGDDMAVIFICEGFATGATIREIIGLPVIVAFDAGNLMAVAETFRKTYPQSKFYFAADNDSYQKLKPTDAERVYVGPASEKNTGIVKATQAAAKVKYARVVYPVFPEDCRDTDWNDLALREGEDTVRARIDEALSAPLEEPPAPVKPKQLPKPRKPPPDSHGGLVNWQEQLIYRDKDGHFLSEHSVNYQLLICNQGGLAECFAYDEFHLCTMVVQPLAWSQDNFEVHVVNDSDIRNVDYFLQKSRNLKGSPEKVIGAIEECGLKNSFHPARDHLDGLVWDGKPRLDNWLLTYVKAKDDPAYLRAVGRIWLVAAVKRLMEPGCKFDNMLILEGPQESGKSMTFEILSRFGPPDNYKAYFMNTFNIGESEKTDELMKLAGSVIIEVQEMSGFNRKDDDAMKKFITTTHDTYRAPYGRRPQKWPRQFVLGGSYNPRDGIFKDSTGLRRYWVVATGDKIDLEGLERDREQLWAEAVHRYRSGESLLLTPEISAKAQEAAEDRRIVDDSTHDILEAAAGWNFFETKDILRKIGITIAPGKSQAESRTVCDVLRVNGFRRCKKTRGSRPVWGWEPPLGTKVWKQTEMYEPRETEEEMKFD